MFAHVSSPAHGGIELQRRRLRFRRQLRRQEEHGTKCRKRHIDREHAGKNATSTGLFELLHQGAHRVGIILVAARCGRRLGGEFWLAPRDSSRSAADSGSV